MADLDHDFVHPVIVQDMQRVAQLDHPEVREIVPSHHCVVRFRQRRPVRERGGEAVADALIDVLGTPT